MEDIEVSVKRNKRKLEKIRSDRQGKQLPRDNSTSSIGLIQAATGQDERDLGLAQEFSGSPHAGNSGIENIETITGRSDSRVRSVEPANEYAAQGGYRSDEQVRARTLTVEDAEAKAERERELGRQRQQRYRENLRMQNENAAPQAQNRYSDVTGVTGIGNGKLSFNLKNGNAEPVKLLTKTEAEEALEALTHVYKKGSSLLDDVIEIATVGHEAVSIWELSDDEAEFLANAHLKKAQKEKSAARSARLLLRIHDKLFLTQYISTRVIATSRHVKAAGGLSFK